MGKESKSSGSKKGRFLPESPFRISPDPLEPRGSEEVAGLEKTLSQEPKTVSTSPYEDLGDLPSFYQTGGIYLAARDPHWLFVYWDLDLEATNHSNLPSGETAFYLRVFQSGGKQIDEIRVNSQAKNWYFPIQDAGISYYVELGFNGAKNRWMTLAKSNEVSAPTDSFVDGPVEFASVPFHLSFEKMLGMVRNDLAAGNSLVGALSKLQDSDDKHIQQMAALWTDEQRLLLETLVGTDLISRISLGSGEVDQIFRQRLSEALSEKLSSGASSEMSFLQDLADVRWSDSSLFSGTGASWSSIGGGESSWTAALGGESSWFGELGSSWSAQPFSRSSRDFYMHVNAEVIFYGGTHPDASVWIDGREIKLAADGSFRYHFRLPDGEFEIPIVAESPDGVEIRSAKLVFKRRTTRTGDVGSTVQPGHLNPPFGAR